jgi:hypothetical protein
VSRKIFFKRLNFANLPSGPTSCCPNIIRNGEKLLLRNQATKVAYTVAGSDSEAVMRAHIVIAVFAALAMFAVTRAVVTPDRTIDAPDCTADCSGRAAEADNGIGSRLPIDPKDYDNDGNDDN